MNLVLVFCLTNVAKSSHIISGNDCVAVVIEIFIIVFFK